MNIIIAGADGLIGRSLVQQLKQDNNLTTIGFYTQNSELTFSGDLSNKKFTQQITSICPRPKILIFLVGLAHKKGKGAEYELFEKVNYCTLKYFIDSLNSKNKLPDKIIFSSTVSVYGERKNVMSYDEKTEPNPLSPYSTTKLRAENYLIKTYPKQSWILRFAPVYSSDFMVNIERRTQIKSILYRVGNGNNLLSLCNLKNIHCAIEGILIGNVPAGVYNISDISNYTYNDLLRTMAKPVYIRIPKILIKLTFILGQLAGSVFLKENSLKLLKDNTFPSIKVREFVELPYSIKDP